jgi:arylsulfatase A-like enzyme
MVQVDTKRNSFLTSSQKYGCHYCSVNRVQFRSAFFFLWGVLAGAVLLSSFEILWIVDEPFLPWKILRLQGSYPPRQLGVFILAAFLTQLVLAAVVGLLALLIGHRWIRSREWSGAFGVGYAFSSSCFAFVFWAVWINLLTEGDPFRAIAVARVLVLAFALVGAGFMINALVARYVRRWRSAVALSVVPPVVFIIVAYLIHAAVVFPASYRDVSRPPAVRPLPTIILVTIDTLRADHVGVYSSTAPTTPALNRLALQGVRFKTAIAQVPTTTPSHISIFTSTYPFTHGAKNGLRMRANLETLPLSLRRVGYYTAAFVSAYTTKGNVTGLGDSFDEYHDSLNPWFQVPAISGMKQLCFYRILDRLAGNQITASVVNKRLAAWLSAETPTPLFVWVHYFDPHMYDPPDAYRRKYQAYGMTTINDSKALYKGEVEFCDHRIGEMLELFRAKGKLNDAIVVVSADHGEAFLEPHPHPDIGHGSRLYDAALKVPLIWWSPNRFAGGRVVDNQVESIDIAPTILDVLGAPIPRSFRGRSFRPLLLGTEVPWDEEAFSQTVAFNVPALFSLRSRDMKVIRHAYSSEVEVFNLRDDPGETRNVASENSEELERLQARLRAILTSMPQESSYGYDNETIQRLRSLGYLR